MDLSERTSPQFEQVTSPLALSIKTSSDVQVEQTYLAAPALLSPDFLVFACLLASEIISMQTLSGE
jgi:hypothetical protein